MRIWAEWIRPRDKLATKQDCKNALISHGCKAPFYEVEGMKPTDPDNLGHQSNLYRTIKHLLESGFTDVKYAVGPLASSMPRGKAEHHPKAKHTIIIGGISKNDSKNIRAVE